MEGEILVRKKVFYVADEEGQWVELSEAEAEAVRLLLVIRLSNKNLKIYDTDGELIEGEERELIIEDIKEILMDTQRIN